MHARPVRSTAVALAVTGTLTWAPTAHAVPFEPIPSTPAAPADTQVPDTGSVEITAQDATGDVLPGATFLLLDSSGGEAGRGKTDAQGKVTFPYLAPGVHRLKQTATGSPLHEAAADRDVIVTPGATTRLTITDPFKAARILLRAKDAKTGRLLPGATVNIGTGASTLLTLTTGAKGTATGKLPVPSRKTQFWAKEIKAPAGYDPYKPAKSFTAGPGTPVAVTVTNTRTATDPKPDPSDKPTRNPSDTPSTLQGNPDSGDGGAKPSPQDGGTPDPASSTAAVSPLGDSTTKAPAGSLARTGADATAWIAAGAGCLAAAGAIILAAVRHRSSTGSEPEDSGKIS